MTSDNNDSPPERVCDAGRRWKTLAVLFPSATSNVRRVTAMITMLENAQNAACTPLSKEIKIGLLVGGHAGEERTVYVYTSAETRQDWQLPGVTNQLGGRQLRKHKAQDLGAAFWLPGNVLVMFKMAKNDGSAVADSDDDEEAVQAESNGHRPGGVPPPPALRGLVITFGWLVRDDSLLLLEREYDSLGELMEVRHSTAVKGGWSGGRM